MAAIATQFIGISAQPNTLVLSSTKDYQEAWGRYGLANTGQYTSNDIIMVSANLPIRGVTEQMIQNTFETAYRPLLDRAVAANAQFLVGNAKGGDQLVQAYLQTKGYSLTQNAQGFLIAQPSKQTQTFSNLDSFNGQSELNKKETLVPNRITKDQTLQKNSPPLEQRLSLLELENCLPLSKEYMPENIELQQLRTQQIAPVIAGFLKAKLLTQREKIQHDPKTGTMSYEGQENIISFDGTYLKLFDKITQTLKMIAQAHKNQLNHDIQWQSINLPDGSLGLTDADVKKFTEPNLQHMIKQTILQYSQQQQVETNGAVKSLTK